MNDYLLVVDTWESQGEIDESVYKENGIGAIIVRLNDMNGGHHMDTGFEKQWGEAENFLRAPYFVFNPWVNAQENFNWLVANCPDDAHSVLIDIEVRKPNYSPSTYAQNVSSFMNMVEDRWGTKTIYTGGWFLDVLSSWPNDADYWWAQYPYALYPDSATHMSWDEVRDVINENGWTEPFNSSTIPGTFKMWQVSGDKIICPGNSKPIDISVFFGTKDELAAWLGYPDESVPPEPTDVLLESVVGISGDIEEELDVESYDGVKLVFSDDSVITYPLVTGETPEPPLVQEVLYAGTVLSGVNFRTGAGIGYPKIQSTSLPSGTKILSDEVKIVGDDTWLHLTSINGSPVDGWAASIWRNYHLIEYSEVVDVPDDDPNEEPPLESGWLPDPNPPSNLYFSRDGGYKRIDIMSGKGTGNVVLTSEFSSIFIGDNLEGDYLHVIRCNGDHVAGWIDAKASGMILSEIPQEVLHSTIPQKVKEPEIYHNSRIPIAGDFRKFEWTSKGDVSTRPSTVNIFQYNQSRPGWIQTTEEFQWLLFDLLKLDAPGQPIVYYVAAYASVAADNRAMTDLHDKDDYTDWILGQNLSRNSGYYWKHSITMCGNIAKVLSKNGSEVMLDGVDMNDIPSAEEIHGVPYLTHKATSVYSGTLSNGFPKTVHWPQIKQLIDGDLEKTGTSFPFVKPPYPANIHDSNLVEVENGEDIPVVNLSRWLLN